MLLQRRRLPCTYTMLCPSAQSPQTCKNYHALYFICILLLNVNRDAPVVLELKL